MGIDSPLGLGFAGVGALGEALIREIPTAPTLRLAAVQDTNLDLAATVAARHAAPWHGSDFDALLAVPGVDAAVICTPNAFHVPQAQRALRAGKHVLVQKPLALSVADARATIGLARQLDRVLLVDYSYRFLATMHLLRDALADLGRPRTVAARFNNIYSPGGRWFFDPALSGGGALIDLGVHLIDLMLWLFSPREVTIEAVSLSFDQGHAVENAAHLALRLDDLPATLDVGWSAAVPETDISLDVVAEGGRARWTNVGGSYYHFRAERDGATLLDRETALRDDTLRVFAEALATGRAPPIDLRVYELLDAAYRLGRPKS